MYDVDNESLVTLGRECTTIPKWMLTLTKIIPAYVDDPSRLSVRCLSVHVPRGFRNSTKASRNSMACPIDRNLCKSIRFKEVFKDAIAFRNVKARHSSQSGRLTKLPSERLQDWCAMNIFPWPNAP